MASSPKCPKVCECGKIDWSGGPWNYKYVGSGKPYDQFIPLTEGDVWPEEGSSCQDKDNAEVMNGDEYETICQYIPGKPGSKFPEDVYEKLLSGAYNVPEDLQGLEKEPDWNQESEPG